MGKITTLSLIESMERELDSIETDLIEANKIEDMDERQEALQELFNERDIVVSFYQEMISRLTREETMSINDKGELDITY